jgi:competence protein ComEC
MAEWQKIPFVRLIIPFIFGILAATFGHYDASMVFTVILLFSFLSAIALLIFQVSFKWRWVWGVVITFFLFSLGYDFTFFKNELNISTHFQKNLRDSTQHTIIGVVTDKAEKANFYRLTVSVKSIEHDSFIAATGNVQVYLRKDSLTAPPQYGDFIVLNSAIKRINSPTNPDAFDFQWYWHLQNIHYQCFTDFKHIKILAHDKGNVLYALSLSWQQYFLSVLKKYLPTENEYAVAAALLIGNKEAITDDIKNAYIETGAMHILAISGMHIILIFNHIEWILDLYKTGNRRWRWIKTVILIVLIGLFALLMGLGASILRAALMAGLVSISKALKIKVSIFNTLAASALILLLWNPYWILDIGFQLSYAAVIGIALFGEKLKRLWVIKNKYSRWVWENISIGLVAQMMVAPISLYYFHQFPTYFWLSGLVAGAVSEFALFTGVLLLGFGKIEMIGFLLGEILFCSIWLMNNFIFLIKQLPFSVINGFLLGFWEVVILYLSISGFYYAFKIRKARLLYYPLSMLLLFLISQGFTEISSHANRELIVYDIPRKSVIDVIIGKKCYSFSKEFSIKNVPDSRMKFAVENHRNSLSVNILKTFNFNEYKNDENIIYRNGYMQIEGVRVLLLDRLPKTGLSLSNCFVVVYDNPKFNISQLRAVLDFKQVIFDSSNSRWRVEKWKNECEEKGLNYHDVGANGAWVYKF